MPLSLTIEIAEGAWNCAVADLEQVAEATVRSTLVRAAPELANSRRPVEIGLTFADDAFLQGLNRDWRGKDKPTNVLSFPVGASRLGADDAMPLPLGDVVLGFQTVMHEAGESGTTCVHHTQHLIVHGVLHLLGHDHEAEDEATRMETLETEILAGIGVADPYTVTT